MVNVHIAGLGPSLAVVGRDPFSTGGLARVIGLHIGAVSFQNGFAGGASARSVSISKVRFYTQEIYPSRVIQCGNKSLSYPSTDPEPTVKSASCDLAAEADDVPGGEARARGKIAKTKNLDIFS